MRRSASLLLLLSVVVAGPACDRPDDLNTTYSCTVLGAGACIEYSRVPGAGDSCRAFAAGPCNHQGVGCRVAPDEVIWYYHAAGSSPPGPFGVPADCVNVDDGAQSSSQ